MNLAQAESIPISISFQRILDKYNVSVGAVEAITQDQQGYIWFGGENGLLRFDGYDLRLMDQLDSTGQQVKNIFFLFQDSRGILWISTSTGLVRYYPEQERFVRYDNTDTSKMQLASIRTKHMAELPNGDLLLATDDGLTIIDVKKETTRIMRNQLNNKHSILSNHLWAVAIDKKGNVWLGGDQGVDGINWATGEFTHYQAKPNTDDGLTHNQVLVIAVDKQDDVWIGTSQGLNRLSPATGKITQFIHNPNDPTHPLSLGASGVRSIFHDARGTAWIGTDQGGLLAYDEYRNEFRRYKTVAGAADSLNSNVVRSLFEDKTGDLWIGNYPNGINYYDRSTAVSTIYTSNPSDPKSLSNNTVTSISPEGKDKYWLGTLTDGLNYFDRKTGSFSRYAFDPNNPNSLSTNAGIRTFIDSDGVLWVGTWGGGMNKFDKKSGAFIRYNQIVAAPPGISKSKTLNSANVRVFKEDSLGNLWLGTQGGALNQFNRATGEFTHYMPNRNDRGAILHEIVYSIFEDSQARLWVGTQSSLELMDRQNGTFTHFLKIDKDNTSLSSGTIYSIFEDSKKRVWFGTSDGLNLLNDDGKTFRRFGKPQGFNDSVIRSITQGSDGNLWIGTGNGISSFNPETYQIKNYAKNSGWQKGNFNPGAVAKGPNGELFFGGDNGLTVLDLSELNTNAVAPPIAIVDFKLFTDSIKIGGDDGLLAHAIDHTNNITLNYHQSMFSFEFSALNFRDSGKNEYAYRLQGFDTEWRKVGTRRYATFTNIDAGNYIFQVKGSNNDGVWNEQGVTIHIHVLPPWWRTWWAYVLYALASLGVLTWIFLHQQYKRSLVEEQNKKLIALDRLKDDFIANTSHELRTPLNGIIGLADSLLEGAAGDVNEIMSVNLKMISSSGKRLASLVNDILDFSKLKTKSIQIKPHPVNLYEIAQSVLSLCSHNTQLTLTNKIKPDLTAVLADDERLQQILFNLVGNAIKFTHQGSVTLDADDLGDTVLIKVMDTGIGIPTASLGKIFNSFEQLEDHRDRSYSGTGLGLAVTKQLVEAHGGKIRVESQENVGSCFSFTLTATQLQPEPTAHNRAPMESIVTKVSDTHEVVPATPVAPAVVNKARSVDISIQSDNPSPISAQQFPAEFKDNSQFNILIVDDNPINRQVLINQLTLQNYRFDVASDGVSALKLIADGAFDLILLDIMMPHMSGYEVCAKLRETHPMEDLPVIFLTAKNTIADLVSGFEVGANDFLTKPISIGELNSRVKTHLQLLNINRKLEDIIHERTSEVALAHRELKILDEIVSIINHEIRIDRLLSVILKETASLFPGTSYVAYWKLDERSDCFNLVFTDNEHKATELAEAIARREVEDLFINARNKIADDIYLLPALRLSDEDRILIGLPETKSMLSMAFKQRGAVSGILILGARDSDSAFMTMLTTNYVRLRNHIDSALSKARLLETLERQCQDLEQVGLTDPLTGLKNRRFLTKYIDHDISLIQRKYFSRLGLGGKPPSPNEDDFIFFLMDIDDFKKTNDIYGHSAGDRVLADMQQILEPIFRTSDYRIRWGGEEFLIVARFCDRENAAMKAEQLRTAVENFQFVIEEGKVIRKTCSIGYACYPFSTAEPKAFTWSQVISLADLALYAVKKSQKNGWLGITHNEKNTQSAAYHVIMENINKATIDGHISISTNLPSINWE